MSSQVTQMTALPSSSLGQTTIVSLPFYGYDSASLYGSVIAATSGTATISLACPPRTLDDDNDEDDYSCGLFPQQTLTVGPSVYNMYMAEGTDFVGTQACNPAGRTEAVCTESASGASANFPGLSTVTYSGSDSATGVTVFPVTVTGGVDALVAAIGDSPSGSNGGGPASTTASATSSGSRAGSSTSAPESSSRSTTSSGSSAASASPSSAGIKSTITSGLLPLVAVLVGSLAYCL